MPKRNNNLNVDQEVSAESSLYMVTVNWPHIAATFQPEDLLQFPLPNLPQMTWINPRNLQGEIEPGTTRLRI